MAKAKAKNTLIRLFSSAKTGYFYTAIKKKGTTNQLIKRKYDPLVREHVLFVEGKKGK
ncbi:hypothetical protein BT69DRAFT_1283536 [Atractiella rhizophila]|nr:hypothetical protein BT69DRAFT_1283536 [Atractiella rhizophila]